MVSVVDLGVGGSSGLCGISLARRTDGSIEAIVHEMAPALIETTASDVPERMRIIALWMSKGAVDLLRQARALETQEHVNDG
jgi:hypothetical protein